MQTDTMASTAHMTTASTMPVPAAASAFSNACSDCKGDDNQLKGINDSQGCEGIGRVLAHEKAVNDVVKCLNQLCQHNRRSSFQENASNGGSAEKFVLIFSCHKMSSTFCFASMVFDTIWLQDTSRRQLWSSWLSLAEEGDSPQCGEMSPRDKREGHPLNRRTSCPP